MRIKSAEALRYHSRWLRSRRSFLVPGLIATAAVTVVCTSRWSSVLNPLGSPCPDSSTDFDSWLQSPDESILLSLEGVGEVHAARRLVFTAFPAASEAWFSIYAMCDPDASMEIHSLDRAGRIETRACLLYT